MEPVLKPGRNCRGIYGVKKTGLLIDGRNYYRAFYLSAQKARHYVLIAGWQFDSKVALLRGEDLKKAQNDVFLLPFLSNLCDRNPDLHIYLLAWDFSILFALKREWLQKWVFEWNANERIHFRFDSRHAVGAGHHQKFVVIDGILAFVGGMDICSNRWDDRLHLSKNPNRINASGKSYELYHDIQSCHI